MRGALRETRIVPSALAIRTVFLAEIRKYTDSLEKNVRRVRRRLSKHPSLPPEAMSALMRDTYGLPESIAQQLLGEQ